MNDQVWNLTPKLSKSRFMAGLQCHKRLYLECFHFDLADPLDEGRQAILDAGTRIGELARDLYSGGVLIEEDHLHHGKAVSSTEKALADSSVQTIWEAAFVYDGVRIRADILTRSGIDTFDLIEVKAGTSVKKEHIPDVAVQLYVLRGCGIQVNRVHLAHLNKEYVYKGGDYDFEELFLVEDVTEDAYELLSDVPLALHEMRLSLRGPEAPFVEIGRHCMKPYTCPFYGYCHINQSKHHISELPVAREKLLQSLEEAGIDDIRHIPENFPGLNEIQRRVRDCVVNNQAYFDPKLAEALRKLVYPIHFLDFETFGSALPLYIGTRPYQLVPFQWSNHTIIGNGELGHQEFLYDGFDDPREPFAKSLLEALGSSGPIVVYTGYEAMCIRELAMVLPDLHDALMVLAETRLVDLHKLIRDNCYHPEFHGSFSIKSVLPALVPDLDYSDLEVSDGMQAQAAYMDMVQQETPAHRKSQLRRSLLAYCKRDTEAEVRLFEVLKR